MKDIDIRSYFIRHKFGVWKKQDDGKWIEDVARTKEVLKEAWEANLAVIDYLEVKNPENAFNPDAPEYKNDLPARKTLRKVKSFFESGAGLIAVFSAGSHPNRMRIGRVGALTKGRLHSFKAYPNYSFKVIEYDFSAEVEIEKYSSLFTKIPRQTTFTHWPSARKALNQIYRKEEPRVDEPSDLDPSQLEILCYEWMRENGYLKYLTMPVGRTMRYVDIVGINKNSEKVFAQVTFHSKEHEWKVKSLKENFKGSLYFFCDGLSECKDGINFVSIQEVFDYFANNSEKRIFLEHLVGRS